MKLMINLRTDLDGFTSEGKHPNNFLFVYLFCLLFFGKICLLIDMVSTNNLKILLPYFKIISLRFTRQER